MARDSQIDETEREKPDLPTQARESFDRFVRAWAPIKEHADECMKCLSADGPMPDGERKARSVVGQERPCLHEDMLTQYVNKAINTMEANPIGIQVDPDGPGTDADTAKFKEDRIRHIDYESNAVIARDTALSNALTQCIGIYEVGTDWAQPPLLEGVEAGDIKDLFRKKITTISAADPWVYVLDPDCLKPDWSDQKEAFKIAWYTHDEFRRQFPGHDEANFRGLAMDPAYSKWINEDKIQVAEWWRVEKTTRKAVIITDRGMETGFWEDKLPEELRNSPKITDSRDIEVVNVMKRMTNGVAILKETTWEDYEIPLLIATGRISYEKGERKIDALISKAITGQLIHDYLISAIQEESGRAVKVKMLGAEGTFDTSTRWVQLHRDPSAYAEYAIVYDKNGQPMPPPRLITDEPHIQQLLEAKQSNLIDIQNMIGMSSTERMDRTAKSGKALEALQDDSTVGSAHFMKALKIQIEREGRIKDRLLAKIDPKTGKVSTRNAKGDHEQTEIPANAFDGRHLVTISAGKSYASQHEETKDVFEQLSKSPDPNIHLAAMPTLIRMMELGPEGEELATELEAIQPPQMQQARQALKQSKTDPAAAAKDHAAAQQKIAMLTQHAQQLQQLVKQQAQQIDSKTIEMKARKDIELGKAGMQKIVEMGKQDLEMEKLKLDKYKIDTTLEIARISAGSDASTAAAKIESDQRIAAEDHSLEFDLNQLNHHQGMQVADQQHQQATELQGNDQAHQAGMQGTQLDAAAQQAELAAQNQPEAGV